MPSTVPAPSLNIPESSQTVKVFIIDSTTRVNGLPAAAFTNPQIPGAEMIKDGVSYAFLIKHKNPDAPSKFDTLVFDLGARKDFENGPTVLIEQAQQAGFRFTVDKDVATILKESGQDLNDVGAVIWSHYHAVSIRLIRNMIISTLPLTHLRQDHTGDPNTFPKTTTLIVGPGFKDFCVPGWPTKPDSQLDEKAWVGRDLHEISFSSDGLTIGQYKAMDFYGDGSLYLIDSPGHATGHMCALARTRAEPPEFILMGGDVAHHGGEFRPTEYVPLPDEITPNPLAPPFQEAVSTCLGSLFQAIHPKKSTTEPYLQATGFFHEDTEKACNSVEGLFGLDAQENVFTVIAHDKSLTDIVDFYPKSAVDWKSKGWKREGHWRFLRDFDTGSD